MMELTRREFLYVFGFVGVTSTLDMAGFATLADASAPVRGRVLKPSAIYPVTDVNAGKVGDIWADAIVNIRGSQAGWFETEHGYIPIKSVQPIANTVVDRITQVDDYTVVSAPVAILRAYCDVRAEQVERVGHGGVMRVIDRMEHPQSGWWLRVTDEHTVGWTQQNMWRATDTGRRVRRPRVIKIDRDARTLSTETYRTRINIPAGLEPGTYSVQRVAQCMSITNGQGRYAAVPSALRVGDRWEMYGVYWHNDFGRETSAIEMNVLVAADLWASDEITLRVT